MAPRTTLECPPEGPSVEPGRLVPESFVFIESLLVEIHLLIEMILADRPCAMGIYIPFSRQPYIYLPMQSRQNLSFMQYRASSLIRKRPPP